MIKIGSLFAGIGGFELGLERAIPNSETVWQVEQEPFCQKILKKHWPQSKLFDDVRTVGAHNLEQVDIICGGFPCQDISVAGLGKGIEGEKSGLWFEMLRIIRELRPRIAVMENVPIITSRGLSRVLGGLSEVGFDVEWTTISARQFGAPHLRRRWFGIAYQSRLSDKRRAPSNPNDQQRTKDTVSTRGKLPIEKHIKSERKFGSPTNPNSERESTRPFNDEMEGLEKLGFSRSKTHWQMWQIEPLLRRMDDGFPSGLHRTRRIKALGNAIVPQCSEYIGRHIFKSGVLS